MRKLNKLYLGLLPFLLLGACSEQEDNECKVVFEKQAIEVVAPTIPSVKMKWSTRDTLGVYTDVVTNGIFLNQAQASSSTIQFNGLLNDDAHRVVVYTPYASKVEMKNEKLFLSLPEFQRFIGNDSLSYSSIPHVGIGTVASGLQLSPVCGVLRLSVKGNIELASLTFSSEERCLSGNGTIDLSNETEAFLWSLLDENQNKSVSLIAINQQLSTTDESTYLLVLPLGHYAGYTVTAITTDGLYLENTFTTEIDIQVGETTSIPSLVIVDPTLIPDPDPLPEPSPDPEPDPTPDPAPTPDPVPDPTPNPEPDPNPGITPEPDPIPHSDTLWVKGINPPADKWQYEKSAYRDLQYMHAYEGCGWYDVDKQYITNLPKDIIPGMNYGTDDYYLCWAASAANVVHYTMDRYADLLKQLPGYAVSNPRSWLVNPLKGSSYGHISEVMEALKEKYPDGGDMTYMGYLDYLFGENKLPGILKPWLDSDEVYMKTLKTIRKPTLQKLSETVRSIIESGGIFTFSVQLSAGGHAITGWGATFNENGELDKVYITNSDDQNGLLALKVVNRNGSAHFQISNTSYWPINNIQLYGALDELIKAQIK